MMRKSSSIALMAAMLCLVGVAKDAGATVTIALIWGACGGGTGGCTAIGTNAIDINPGGGQTLRLDVFLSHDEPGGLSGHGFSLNFDTDFLNELNVGAMGGVEWAGTDLDPSPAVNIYGPLSGGIIPATPESQTGGPAGRLNTFESVNPTQTLPVNGAVYSVGTFTATAPARYRVAQVFFVANEDIPDGADVFSGLFHTGFDAIRDSVGNELPGSSLSFGTASLGTFIPEPGSASLLALGLVGLVLAARRSRCS